MLVEVEVVSVVLEILPDQGVVHEVGIVLGHRVAAVAHHLLAGDSEANLRSEKYVLCIF